MTRKHYVKKLNWCLENQCGYYPHICRGVDHPALCPYLECHGDRGLIGDLAEVK